MLNKHSLKVIGKLRGFHCSSHPLRGCLDPAAGQWLAIGDESGQVSVYNVHNIVHNGNEGEQANPGGAGHAGKPGQQCRPAYMLATSFGHAMTMTRQGGPEQPSAMHRSVASATAAPPSPVYCVAWNPALHMLAVSSRGSSGQCSVLVHLGEGATQTLPRCDSIETVHHRNGASDATVYAAVVLM